MKFGLHFAKLEIISFQLWTTSKTTRLHTNTMHDPILKYSTISNLVKIDLK